MSQRTIVIQPGGKLTVQGQRGGTTSVEVQAPTIPKQPTPADPTGTVAITATATLIAAAAGQLFAHRWTQRRERRASLRLQLAKASEAVLQLSHRLFAVSIAFHGAAEHGPGATLSTALTEFISAGSIATEEWHRYFAMSGTNKKACEALKQAMVLLYRGMQILPDGSKPDELRQAGEQANEVAGQMRRTVGLIPPLKAHQ